MEPHMESASDSARLSQAMQEANANGARLLLVDLELAITMLDTAQTTRNSQTRLRNVKNAMRARDLVLHLRTQLDLDDAQLRQMDEHLTAINSRLDELRRC
jgi:hypothetical protein